jgi:pyruvate/2-oxoglutarate/acetoin dehydrogenase E1 component
MRPSPPPVTRLNFVQAINAALRQSMELDDSIFVYGIGADKKSAIFGSTAGLVQQFGPKRVFDTPISEQGLTAIAAGAAHAGLRPVLVHQRVDFMLYTIDHLVNWIASWRYVSGGRATMPLTIRAIVGKGWGQGPQHSKSLHSWFAHVPGFQVVIPGSPADAKGLLMSSIMSNDPTIFIEFRSLYAMQEEVPDEPYFIRHGQALVRRPGKDLTLVVFGATVSIAMEATEQLEKLGIEVEVIDLRTLAPLDMATVLASVAKTRRLLVAEMGWLKFGAASEIIAAVCEQMGNDLAARPKRVGWPQSFVPTSPALEKAFYPTAENLTEAAKICMADGH